MTHLGARIVKLPSLADGQSSRAQDEDLPGAVYLFRLWRILVGEVVHQTLLHWKKKNNLNQNNHQIFFLSSSNPRNNKCLEQCQNLCNWLSA